MSRTTRVRQWQRVLAPGTPLRDGLDRVLHGRTGALVVMGNNTRVQQYSSGGFKLNVDFTPQSLRELAKMDGAIILSNNLDQIVAAGVQLMPPGGLPTAETGTRHRSADRLAQAAGVPTITVSASMSTISLFMDGYRYAVEPTERLLSRANQTLTTLSSFVDSLDDHLRIFSGLEVSNQVTLRDLAMLARRYEMTRRLSAETRYHVDMLGAEARHVELQHAELTTHFAPLGELLVEDYAHNVAESTHFDLDRLHNFSAEELHSPSLVLERLGFGPRPSLESTVSPRGLRVLTVVGRLPHGLASKLVDRYALQEMFGASVAMMTEIDGIGQQRARLIRDALQRISDSAHEMVIRGG